MVMLSDRLRRGPPDPSRMITEFAVNTVRFTEFKASGRQPMPGTRKLRKGFLIPLPLNENQWAVRIRGFVESTGTIGRSQPPAGTGFTVSRTTVASAKRPRVAIEGETRLPSSRAATDRAVPAGKLRLCQVRRLAGAHQRLDQRTLTVDVRGLRPELRGPQEAPSVPRASSIHCLPYPLIGPYECPGGPSASFRPPPSARRLDLQAGSLH